MSWQRKNFQREAGDEGLLAQLSNPEKLVSILQARWRGKFYENQEGDLPEGRYIELNTSGGGKDARRGLLEVDTGDLYLTTAHYATGTFKPLGNIGFSPSQMLVGTSLTFI